MKPTIFILICIIIATITMVLTFVGFARTNKSWSNNLPSVFLAGIISASVIILACIKPNYWTCGIVALVMYLENIGFDLELDKKRKHYSVCDRYVYARKRVLARDIAARMMLYTLSLASIPFLILDWGWHAVIWLPLSILGIIGTVIWTKHDLKKI